MGHEWFSRGIFLFWEMYQQDFHVIDQGELTEISMGI
jgi:hypothetical protein